MLTHESLLRAAKQQGAYGEGQHFFAGRPYAGRLVRSDAPPGQKESGNRYGSRGMQRLRIEADKKGRIKTLDPRTGKHRWLRLIRVR